jgi:hypothetical protein
MADIASLFGLTPEGLAQQRYQQDLKQGYELAQLDPGAAARATLQSGVGQLGRGIAGLMGVEDPQMKLISARQSILSQTDQTDPASLLKSAKTLFDMGDQQGGFALADYARKAQSEIAQAQQRTAAANRERQQATPNDIQIATQMASLTDAIDQLKAQPASPERNRAMNLLTTQLTQLERLTTKPEKDLRFGTDRESISAELYDRSFASLTPAERAIVNKRVEEEQGKKAEKSAPKVYTPGSPVQPKDWMDFTQKVLSGDPVMQRTSTILSDAPSAIDIIRQSTSNDFASASLPSSIARLTGEGKNMSNADVNRFARTGGLDDRLAQDAVKFFTGGTTQVKKEQAEKFAVALYRGALIERKKKLETSAEEFGYTDSPNYKTAVKNIDDQLAQFKLVKKGETSPPVQKTGNPLIDKYLFKQAENQ